MPSENHLANVKIKVCFSDLVHTYHSCKVIPYGSAMVAAYLLKYFRHITEVDIFKNPLELIEYLQKNVPKIACFSHYVWNSNISCEFAKRIKKQLPDIIIVFGGPNYPLSLEEQGDFLLSHPEIDFYIQREGEQAFVKLFNQLMDNNFSKANIGKKKCIIPNCDYIYNGLMIKGNLMQRNLSLDEIPSPYLSGLCDKFLNTDLIPLLQTTRGCPFTCTYCQEGNSYFNRISRFSVNRVRDEIEYIAQRTKVPTLQLTDSNFGMYSDDINICYEISKIQKKYNWPKYFSGIDGKNKKDQILEAAKIVNGSFLGAAVQSCNTKVLKNIKRDNVSITQMIQIAKEGESLGSSSFSELILCLPGDTKDAHLKSNFDLIDAGMDVVRSHQFIMLPGSEAATKENREKYQMATRFRVIPKTVVPYFLFGNTFFAPEIDEICVANSTMSFEDYLECRMFNLTVEIFYNNGIFYELIKFLKLRYIKISSFIRELHEQIRLSHNPLTELYQNFLKETNELWENKKDLANVLESHNILEKYMKEELGNNEQLLYRTIAIIDHIQDLHQTAFGAAEKLLQKNVKDIRYLKELFKFSMMRKKDILSVECISEDVFNYDFSKLFVNKFNDDPEGYYTPASIKISVFYTCDQKELILKNLKIYGTSKNSLGYVLGTVLHNTNIYRVCELSSNV